MACVGVGFDLNDPDHTDVGLDVTIWFRNSRFEVEADATVADPVPVSGGYANSRYLLDLPTVCTTDLDECLAALRDHTSRLCAYTSILDDLGVPRGRRYPPTPT